jgi:hypothetical protein
MLSLKHLQYVFRALNLVSHRNPTESWCLMFPLKVNEILNP